MKLATTYTDCQAVALERIYDKGTVLLSSYHALKITPLLMPVNRSNCRIDIPL